MSGLMRRLSEVAKHLVYPGSIATTGWPRVRAQCEVMGIRFEGWQDGLGMLALGKDAAGVYAASVGGVFLSIPRQVGKTYLVGAMCLAVCVLTPGLTVLWTAHRKPTAMMTLEKLKSMCGRKKVRPHVLGIKTGNNEGSITFRNGSKILFGAREQGFGRGYDEVDVEVFDEAQILTVKALEDMIPAANQSRQPSGALVFYMGTPPRPSDPGEVFAAARRDALSGSSEGTVYVEMGAPDDVDVKAWRPTMQGVDWDMIAAANPSFPVHTSKVAVLRMIKQIPSPASWRREALGVWDEAGLDVLRVVEPRLWAGLATSSPPLDGRLGYGVRFRGDTVTLAACLVPDEGAAHVEVVVQQSLVAGVEWLADWINDRREQRPMVAVDGREGVELLTAALARRRFPSRLVAALNTSQAIAAHSLMLNAVRQGELSHLDQPALNAAVRVAGRRDIGSQGGWGWEAIDDDGDVRPLEAATLAHWAGLNAPSRTGGRRVVVG